MSGSDIRVCGPAYGKTSAKFHRHARALMSLAALTLLAGCLGPPTATGPKRLFTTDDEMTQLTRSLTVEGADVWSTYRSSSDRTDYRNQVIAARLYAIDVNYTNFEHELDYEGQAAEFWSKFASSTLTTVAGTIPVAGTARNLNSAAAGILLGQSAYNDSFFRTKMTQNLTTAMRAARYERLSIIRNRMNCPSTLYPLGLALSDLESYYRAGTLETGFIRITQTVTADEKNTKGNDDVAGKTGDDLAKRTQVNAKAAEATADAAKQTQLNDCRSALETDANGSNSRFASAIVNRRVLALRGNSAKDSLPANAPAVIREPASTPRT